MYQHFDQTWKSEKLCRFIDKLDQRLEKKKKKKSNPANEHITGEALDVSAPSSAKTWMTAPSSGTNALSSEEVSASEEELFSGDSDEDLQDDGENN